jgi:hypothetical protein
MFLQIYQAVNIVAEHFLPFTNGKVAANVIPFTKSKGTPKVGGHSDASTIPNLPMFQLQ